jgi:ATP-dependent helicase/nuclease subunit B
VSQQPAVFTIESGVPFVDALAAGILSSVGEDPVALTAMRILLPTRRACRALALGFLRSAGGEALLLPRMLPLGDLDEDDLTFETLEEPGVGDFLDLPPPISLLRRQLLLARLVQALPGPPRSADQAARLARELARLMDRVIAERLDLKDLERLVPREFAQHWRITIDFLRILTDQWPKVLSEEGCIEAADRRNRLLAAQTELWQRQPPPGPVIAAGSTGSLPATADLLRTVARLPGGAVVLPGMDRDADDAVWAAIEDEPNHPQFGIARLLRHLGVSRRDVRPWPISTDLDWRADRVRLISRAFRPAAAIKSGALSEPVPDAAIANLVRIDALKLEDEARAIALILRETLEHPGRTGALVTPDRALARRVTAELNRWQIDVDDSAGLSLSVTVPGVFFRLVARMAVEQLAPVDLLAVLKHPLAACGLSPAVCRAQSRRLERGALRGPRPPAGVAGILGRLTGDDDGDARSLIETIARAVAPMLRLVESAAVRLPTMLTAHVKVVEALAATTDVPGPDRLWVGDAGEALAAFVEQLSEAGDAMGPLKPNDYPPLIDVLMAGHVVRSRYGRHPRLAIWGPLEARLQQADVMILGGLNEGVWPPAAAASPWMSRPMMEAFGLPAPERRIGLSAHDFSQAVSGGRVWLTRSLRKDGAPTVASRWLLRLDTVLKGSPWHERNQEMARQWLDWQAALDRPAEARPASPPAACPPLGVRPRTLSVTQVETWMRDPYALYAQKILRLSALEPLDADPTMAEYGSFVHKALDRFVKAFPRSLPADAYDRLLDMGRDSFGSALDRPNLHAFWWPRFERIAAWFIDEEARRVPSIVERTSEISGAVRFQAPGGVFSLTAKADRIDRRPQGSLVIIDYKTGRIPSKPEIVSGLAPQLPLEAAIANTGGFGRPPGTPIAALEHWRLTGGDPAGELEPVGDDPVQLAETALAGVKSLVTCFDDPAVPYLARPRPWAAPPFSDYEHLERVQEWSTGTETGE